MLEKRRDVAHHVLACASRYQVADVHPAGVDLSGREHLRSDFGEREFGRATATDDVREVEVGVTDLAERSAPVAQMRGAQLLVAQVGQCHEGHMHREVC